MTQHIDTVFIEPWKSNCIIILTSIPYMSIISLYNQKAFGFISLLPAHSSNPSFPRFGNLKCPTTPRLCNYCLGNVTASWHWRVHFLSVFSWVAKLWRHSFSTSQPVFNLSLLKSRWCVEPFMDCFVMSLRSILPPLSSCDDANPLLVRLRSGLPW